MASSKLEYKDLQKSPSPKGQFLLGNLKEFKKINKHQILEQWSKEVGEIYQISLMGKKIFVSADTNFNGEVLKGRPTTFRRYSKIKEVMDEMGIEGVFAAEGEQWKQHRKITADALSMKNVKAFFPVLKKMTERLFNRWHNFSKINQGVDIQQEMMLYTIDITTLIAFGYDTNTLESDGDIIQNHLNKVFPMINKRIIAPIPLWRFYKSKKDQELNIALKEIKSKVDEYIQSSKEKLNTNVSLKENPTNFLEALLVEQEKNPLFSNKDIFGNVFTLLLAGEDTTSNSISWAIYYLLLHPEILNKLNIELQKVLKGDAIIQSNEQLNQLHYTEAIVLETFRINPTTPTLIMEANEDTIIQDYYIPKDTTILLHNKVAQTDESNFEKANEFIPERWIKTAGCPMYGNHRPEVIRTFGGGSRFCPGKNLAIQEMKMGLATIFKNFDLQLDVAPEEITEVFAFTMHPENLKVSLNIRTSS